MFFFPILIIIAGLILKEAGPWFEDQAVVGKYVFIAGVILVVIELVVYLAGLTVFKRASRRTRW